MVVDLTNVALVLLAVSALAALFTAIFNYLSRPLVITAKEQHSKRLQELLYRWQASVLKLDLDPFVTFPASVDSQPEDLQPDFEDDPLFKDLEQHVIDCNLFRDWKKFKDDYRKIDEEKISLSNRIREDVEQTLEKFRLATDIKIGAKTRIEVTEKYIGTIYRDSLNVARGEVQEDHGPLQPTKQPGTKPDRTWCKLLSKDGCIAIVYFDESPSERAAEKLLRYAGDLFGAKLRNLSQEGTLESGYVVKSRAIAMAHGSLNRQLGIIKKEIEELTALPLIPGDCKYIKRATSVTYRIWHQITRRFHS
jgi:hypothetical protein